MMPHAIRSLANGGTTLEDLRRAVSDAPPEANLVLVQCQEGTVQFPTVCPNCERRAESTLRIQRAFLFHIQGEGDTPNSTEPSINEIDIPFCGDCLRRQRAESSAPGAWTPLKRVLSEAEGFAGLAVMGIAFLFFGSALKRLSVIPLVLGCLPLMTSFWLLRSTWKKSEYMGLPKPTPVDLAVDFTPYIALAHEPAWRAFQFRSRSYADLFREANAGKLWDPRSSEARSAHEKRRASSFKTNLVVGAIVVAVLLWSLWREELSQYVLPLIER